MHSASRGAENEHSFASSSLFSEQNALVTDKVLQQWQHQFLVCTWCEIVFRVDITGDNRPLLHCHGPKKASRTKTCRDSPLV